MRGMSYINSNTNSYELYFLFVREGFGDACDKTVERIACWP